MSDFICSTNTSWIFVFTMWKDLRKSRYPVNVKQKTCNHNVLTEINVCIWIKKTRHNMLIKECVLNLAPYLRHGHKSWQLHL